MLDNLPMRPPRWSRHAGHHQRRVGVSAQRTRYATPCPPGLLGGDTLEEPVFDDKTHEIIGTKPIELDKQVTERILHIPGEGVTATEFSAANLQGFIPVIEKAVEHIAAETRTPAIHSPA